MLTHQIEFSKAIAEIYKPISGRMSDPTSFHDEGNTAGIEACEQCIERCQRCLDAMADGSAEKCASCAQYCDGCASECEKHDNEHCQYDYECDKRLY